MRKRVCWLVMVVVLALAAMVSAQEDDTGEIEGGVIYGLVNVDRSEVRAGPDFAYPTVGQLPLNASVEIVGRAGQFYYSWDGRQWLQIQFGDRQAWIYARLVRTAVRFNRIPVTGMLLPRNANGRVPDVFDLSTYVCERWVGDFGYSGNFAAGDQEIVARFPEMPGTSIYSVIVITPTGFRIAFDTETATPVTIKLDELPAKAGTYTLSVVPYWTTSTYRYEWQQVCPLNRFATFDKPETESSVPDYFR